MVTYEDLRKKLKEHWRCYVINFEGISQKRWDTGCLQPLMFLLLFFFQLLYHLSSSLCAFLLFTNSSELWTLMTSLSPLKRFEFLMPHCNARALWWITIPFFLSVVVMGGEGKNYCTPVFTFLSSSTFNVYGPPLPLIYAETHTIFFYPIIFS